VPLLLQLFFWYNAVLKSLPQLRDSVALPGGVILNNRGLFLPRAEAGAGFDAVLFALAAGIVASIALRLWSNRRRARTGEGLSIGWPVLGLVAGLPLAVFAAGGFPLHFSFPQPGRFNVSGGIEILPEFAALTLALSIYTAAFIAEVVRAGLQAVQTGQIEAAQALGLRRFATLRLVVVPQAMRVIIPPLINQYLNLTKNSTLAVAIGYPDLFNVFAGTTLNNTGAAVQIVFMTMAVYLVISLITSGVMNAYNSRMSLTER
jgi:general L-amino acid transport system permease protein